MQEACLKPKYSRSIVLWSIEIQLIVAEFLIRPKNYVRSPV